MSRETLPTFNLNKDLILRIGPTVVREEIQKQNGTYLETSYSLEDRRPDHFARIYPLDPREKDYPGFVFKPNFDREGNPMLTMWDEYAVSFSPLVDVADNFGISGNRIIQLLQDKGVEIRAIKRKKDWFVNPHDVEEVLATRGPGRARRGFRSSKSNI